VSLVIVLSKQVGNHGQNDCDITNQETGKRLFATLFAFAYVLPLSVIGILSALILTHIARAQRSSLLLHNDRQSSINASRRSGGRSSMKFGGGGDDADDTGASRRSGRGGQRPSCRKRQVTRLLVLVVVVFAILWLPIHVHLLLAFFYRLPQGSRVYLALSVLWQILAYFNSCVNPIIYNHTSKDFRDAFRSVVGCICRGCNFRRWSADAGDDANRATGVVRLAAATTEMHLAVSPPRDQEGEQQLKLLQLQQQHHPIKGNASDVPQQAAQAVDENDDDYANDEEEDEFTPERRKNNLAVLGRLRPMLQCPAGERLAVPVVVQLQGSNSQ
jgi:hypothetical protein